VENRTNKVEELRVLKIKNKVLNFKTSSISCTADGNEYVERIQCNRMLKYNIKITGQFSEAYY
jgi:hypothetical protein